MESNWVERWGLPGVRIAIPLVGAFLMIGLEPQFTRLVQDRPGTLPVAMVALLGGLLLARVRRYLIVTLCFSISLLAISDAINNVPPAIIDTTTVDAFYPYGWAILAMLAAGAGVGEAICAGSVLARRCYFATAALYFSVHGLLSLLRIVSWEGVALVVTGLVAWMGVLMAHRIVAAEIEDAPEDDDIRVMSEQNARRAAQLASKEWLDTHEDRRVHQH